MLKAHWFPLLLIFVLVILTTIKILEGYQDRDISDKSFAAFLAAEPVDTVWRGDNKYQIPTYCDSGKLIWYGRDLIVNTAYYLGPAGAVSKFANGMNCQNCHIDGGTVPYGNNFGKVYATYPRFGPRNNSTQTIYDRINDCLQRSLNGRPMDSSAHEMRAIYAYLKWLGEDVPKGVARGGTGLPRLKYLDVAADTMRGKKVYTMNCQTCHGIQGEGQADTRAIGYTYPPLWGAHSYNDGAGLYRIGAFSGFVKMNMPFGTDYHHPKLTDQEAWDVAAYVNSKPRPHQDQRQDWKNTDQKPVDAPFGPYADTFSEQQHKYGPFKPILEAREKNNERF